MVLQYELEYATQTMQLLVMLEWVASSRLVLTLLRYDQPQQFYRYNTIQGTAHTLTTNSGITIGATAGNVTMRGTAASPNFLAISGVGGIP